MSSYTQTLTSNDRQHLIDLGLIIEAEDLSDEIDEIPEEIETFPDADYNLQNEIIKFFINNPGADPEVFRQYATSIGIDPDEFQKQENILLSQLLKLYVDDSHSLGYGDSLTSDEIDPRIQQLVTPDDEMEDF